MNLFVIVFTFLLLYFLFIWKTGKTHPILYLFLFVYFVQYVFSVYLIYNEYPVLRRQMPIDQQELFAHVVPAMLFLFAGVFIFNKEIPILNLLRKVDHKEAARLGHLLLVISFFFDMLKILGVPGVQSVISFTYYLKFIGATCYLFAPSGTNYFLLVIVYLTLIKDALVGGVFIDFFMWFTYFFIIVALRYRLSLAVRSFFIAMAIPVLVVIQSVKVEYREATWSGKRQAGVGLITELAEEKNAKDNDPFGQSEGVVRTVGRLNQGWHLGKVLKWVPNKESFANGEDFLGDIEAAILPRFFFPGKKMGGSQEKFYKYTGHKLRHDTSMTIGVFGDFYVNFGRWGSFIALFIFGAIISRLLYFFVKKYVQTDPINIVWVPFLFSYLIRANNDFYFILNSFVKGFLIFLTVYYLRKQFWPKRQKNHF